MTNDELRYIIAKLSDTNAAIAQPVERILGKDEVASSNLASSSIFEMFDRFEQSNATRMSVAGEGLTEPLHD